MRILTTELIENDDRRARRVVRLEDFTAEEMTAITQSDVPAECTNLDAELKDWRP